VAVRNQAQFSNGVQLFQTGRIVGQTKGESQCRLHRVF
jgi:hypothetical protein